MALRVGLNPYGLTCWVGLQGDAPNPAGLDGFVNLCLEYGARSIELDLSHLRGLSDEGLSELRQRLDGLAIVVSASPPTERLPEAIHIADRLGAKTVRVGLSTVLCGARAATPGWDGLVAQIRDGLCHAAPLAEQAGLSLAIEDHQDFGSEELVAFCLAAGPSVGITFDTGNPLAVGEAPLDFAQRVAPHVRHLHLKDYRVQPTDEGFRLVRCAIGEGAIDFGALLPLLPSDLTASLEPGALEARHIRLLCPDWWRGYPSRSALELVECLAATKPNALSKDEDYQTPWERADGMDAVCRYEREMMDRSVAFVKGMGWL